MKRLTREKRHKVCDGGKHPTKYTSGHTFQEVVARLAAYEDTGLEPEEVVALTRVLDTAAKLLTGYGHCTHYPGYICDKGFTTLGVCEVCIKEHLLGREKAKEG